MKKRNYLKVQLGGKERLLNVSEKTIQNLGDVIEKVSETILEESALIIYKEKKGGVDNVVENSENDSRSGGDDNTSTGKIQEERTRRGK